MIQSLENKNKKELIEIVKIQFEEYQIASKRIAELEAHNLGLTKTLVEFEQERKIRDLEQQAKICEFLAETTYTDTAHGITEQFRLFQTARGLHKQAKQLRMSKK